MSKFLKLALSGAIMVGFGSPVMAEKLGLGRAALPEEIAAWNKDVRPDGTGLPVGSGNVADGEEIFADKCAACHGDFAEGVGNWPKLAGGFDTLNRQDPVKTVGSYWPHLSTTFDYIDRSMPFGDAQSLTTDEVYAIVAYILFSNDLVEDDFVLSNENLAGFEMPNRDGFFVDNRDDTEYAQFSQPACMENCKEDVKITMHATVLDVTPGDPSDGTGAPPGAAGEGGKAAPETAAKVTAETPAPTPETAAADPELVAAGEKVFKKCAACHKVGEGAQNSIGPALNGIIDHPAGALEGFNYSTAMTAAGAGGLVWDAASLDQYLIKPRDLVKGTKMTFAGLKDEGDRAAVIAYLSTFAK
ncbi:c-type cytochrome [Pseudorhodobacter sp.]|uniref:c-type cytochrome n=1 Tax=Pseudorhodobacter sp. TaxID=1934400 RepID=UPI002647246F|nr:c-type cytochrome [Pseudorhodobacter sp.]MDN5786769.1 c-type cytochrome [Pseudorhodobacter sp.]